MHQFDHDHDNYAHDEVRTGGLRRRQFGGLAAATATATISALGKR